MASKNMEEFLGKQKDDYNELEGDIRERFKKLNEDIRNDFTSNLEVLVSGDLRKFHNDLAKSITTAGLSFLEPTVDNTFGDISSSSVSADLNRNLNMVVRNAVRSVLDNAVSGVFGSTKTSTSETQRSLEASKLTLSPGQQTALAAKQLKKGSKNL